MTTLADELLFDSSMPMPECGLPIDSEPTAAKCGSDAKIEVMRLRAAHGMSVFHPEDNRQKIEKFSPELLARQRRLLHVGKIAAEPIRFRCR